MDLNIGDMLNEIQRELAQNGTDIVLQWNAVPPGVTPDPVDGSVSGLIQQTMTLPAFVHQVQATGASSVRQFNEVETGNIILDFAEDIAIDGLSDLVFLINGKAYVAKEIGERLAQSWDMTVGSQRLFRSVLVKVKA
jgi:hypothetical protein